MNPAVDMVTLAAGAGLGLVVGTSAFYASPECSGERVWASGVPVYLYVWEDDGPPSRPAKGGALLRRELVHLEVHGPRDDFSAGRTKARAIWKLLSRPTISGYIEIVPAGSGPGYAGEDQDQCPTWAWDVEAWYEEV